MVTGSRSILTRVPTRFHREIGCTSSVAGALCAALCLAFLSCMAPDPRQERSNPFDPGGNNWLYDRKPDLAVTVSAKPLWSDFDFDDSTGTIELRYRMSDPDYPYDSASLFVSIGTLLQQLNSAGEVHDTGAVLEFDRLKLATRYYYQLTATDSRDSSTTVLDSFETPSGIPPRAPHNAGIQNTTYGVKLGYTPGVSGGIHILRADQLAGPFEIIKDTVCGASSQTGYVQDTINDYRVRYYRTGSYNGFGTALADGILSGSRYASDIGVPYNVEVTYIDSHYVSISWYMADASVTSYEIFRNDSIHGAVRNIGATPSRSYRDTLTLCRKYYYSVAAVQENRIGAQSTVATISVPRAPSYLSLSDNEIDRISLTWQSVSDAWGYTVYRKKVQYGDSAIVIGHTGETVFDDFVDSSGSYYYAVCADNVLGEHGALTSYKKGSTMILGTSSGVEASRGLYSKRIHLSWQPVNDAQSYIIFHGFASDDTLAPLDTVEATSYDHESNDGLTHYYAVSAYLPGNTGARSTVVSGYAKRLAAPVDVNATQGAYHKVIQLSWSEVPGAVRYIIYRSDNPAPGSFIPVGATGALGYSDSVFAASKDFYYQIAAVSSEDEVGAHSVSSIGYLYRTPPPTGVDATDGTMEGCIGITWTESLPSQEYAVYRSTASFGPFVKIAEVNGAGYVDSSIDASGRYYYYKVAYVDSDGVEGVLSEYDRGNAKTDMYPTGLVAAAGYTAGYIRIEWNSCSGATAYNVYRSLFPAGFDHEKIAVTADTFYQDSSAKPDSTYYYRVSWIKDNVESMVSVDVASGRTGTAPHVPVLVVKGLPAGLALTWTLDALSLPADTFLVYRSTDRLIPLIMAMSRNRNSGLPTSNTL
jgi:fibronectin type 3 domain-containing protein